MTERQYLPTLAELIDRLSIVLLKSIFIPENRDAYRKERDAIEHDIDLLLTGFLGDSGAISSKLIRALLALMLANHYIWVNESAVRRGDTDSRQLRATHSINGIRNAAKNIIAAGTGERVDLKVDCLAADLPEEFGNWRDLLT